MVLDVKPDDLACCRDSWGNCPWKWLILLSAHNESALTAAQSWSNFGMSAWSTYMHTQNETQYTPWRRNLLFCDPFMHVTPIGWELLFVGAPRAHSTQGQKLLNTLKEICMC